MGYGDYLRSDHWQDTRRRVLQRANGFCEGCLQRHATQVHHLTYAHIGAEFLWELVAICDICHSRVHDKPPLQRAR
jgi:5-methylcytosine-specific restriction endonuclease McrA